MGKKRYGFVTNSSSSSFIISSKEQLVIPEKFKYILNPLKSREDLIDHLEHRSGCYFDHINDEKDLLKEKYGFTDDQIGFIKILIMNERSLYEEVSSYIDDGVFIYELSIGRDFLYEDKELLSLIDQCSIIDSHDD